MKRKVKQYSTGQWVLVFGLQAYHRIYGSYSLTDMSVKSAILDFTFVEEASQRHEYSITRILINDFNLRVLLSAETFN